MARNILITGAAGFIGRHVAQGLINRKADLYLMVRPGTNIQRLGNLAEKAEVIETDLLNIRKFKETINKYEFTDIVHIGAIRNRPKTPFDDYLKANIQITEQLAVYAMEHKAKMIFFSSVGVFGTIPSELPPAEKSKKIDDSYYHYSKIESERLLEKYVLYGLDCAIIRPTITYGIGDTGFPYQLIDGIHKKKIFIPDPAPDIHLGNVELLVQAVQKLLDSSFKSGTVYNIGDPKPVNMQLLADYISSQLNPQKEHFKRKLPRSFFRLAEKFCRFFHSHAWMQRFMLFGNDWFFDVSKAHEELNLRRMETIPAIRSTIDWYKKIHFKRKS